MRRTKEEAEQTRASLLEAAETLFLQNGVAHTSLEQIARAAGVTRGAVYWHFQNKADLFHALLTQVRLPPEQLTERLRSCDQQHPLKPMRDMCIEAIESLTQNPKKRTILTILLHRCEFTDELRPAQERHQAFIETIIGQFTEQFKKAEQHGLLHPHTSALQAAYTLHTVTHGLLTEWTRSDQVPIWLESPKIIIDTVFRGLIVNWDPDA